MSIGEKFSEILGGEFFQENVTQTHESCGDETPINFTNSKEIYCLCKTLILRPKHAKLIIPSESMLELEKSLNLLQYVNKPVETLKRGCYWLVDDMYKFEQIAYTKEVNKSNQHLPNNNHNESEQSQVQNDSDNQTGVMSTASGTLRYLACADCNLGPLGWFDATVQESYLFVW